MLEKSVNDDMMIENRSVEEFHLTEIKETMNDAAHLHTHADGTVHAHADGAAHAHADGTVHTHADGTVHAHADGTGHTHSHTHDPAEMKKITNRLARSIGHLESVKRMIESGQDCSDVLIQLAAVKAEINGAGKALLKEHLEHCIVEAVEQQDMESIEKVNRAIDQFMR